MTGVDNDPFHLLPRWEAPLQNHASQTGRGLGPVERRGRTVLLPPPGLIGPRVTPGLVGGVLSQKPGPGGRPLLRRRNGLPAPRRTAAAWAGRELKSPPLPHPDLHPPRPARGGPSPPRWPPGALPASPSPRPREKAARGSSRHPLRVARPSSAEPGRGSPPASA